MYFNIQTPADNGGNRAFLSLDANKAFNSVEWGYLWAVLEKFGFGVTFISWVRLLYNQLQASIIEGGKISACFNLARGTRQGCSLLPLLHALAIEPLAACIRANNKIEGFRFSSIQEKILLYADDMLLLLADTDTSLKNVMSTITDFGRFSGLTINWSKSALLALDQGIHPQLGIYCPVPVIESFKHLGIEISPQPLDFFASISYHCW